MRQLFIQVPRGHGPAAIEAVEDFGAVNVAHLEASGHASTDGGAAPALDRSSSGAVENRDQEAVELVIAHVSNGSVEPLLARLEDIPGLRVSFFPKGVLTLKPPAERAPEQVKDVEERSPVEVLLAGVQSVGTWTGLIGYAIAAGVVVWVGLYTNTIYLLTAAMLIAPFAGPAMNAALATASGDAGLLGQSLVRYAGALGASVLTAAALSVLLGQETATAQMIARSTVSEVALILPLVAGAAGALSLMQSERDDLVSGAAVGVLVAASLAPPVGLVGMAGAIGRWDLVGNAAFVLILQLVGINFTGALVFRLYGLSGRGARYAPGRRWLFPTGLVASGAALAVLLAVQFGNPVRLERASLAQRAVAEVQEVDFSKVSLVEVEARFPRATGSSSQTLLVEVYVRRRDAAPLKALIRRRLTQRIASHLRHRWPEVEPLVSVTVLDGPPSSP